MTRSELVEIPHVNEAGGTDYPTHDLRLILRGDPGRAGAPELVEVEIGGRCVRVRRRDLLVALGVYGAGPEDARAARPEVTGRDAPDLDPDPVV